MTDDRDYAAELMARIAHPENHIESVAKDTHKIMVAYEAALLAAYRLAWDAICGDEELTVVERADDNKERYFYRLGRADAINAALARFEVAMEANPTPTAAELLARIQTGENDK